MLFLANLRIDFASPVVFEIAASISSRARSSAFTRLSCFETPSGYSWLNSHSNAAVVITKLDASIERAPSDDLGICLRYMLSSAMSAIRSASWDSRYRKLIYRPFSRECPSEAIVSLVSLKVPTSWNRFSSNFACSAHSEIFAFCLNVSS